MFRQSNMSHYEYIIQSTMALFDRKPDLCRVIPSGKRLHNYGKSPFSMGKSTISMAMFNSYFDITRG